MDRIDRIDRHRIECMVAVRDLRRVATGLIPEIVTTDRFTFAKGRGGAPSMTTRPVLEGRPTAFSTGRAGQRRLRPRRPPAGRPGA